MSDETLIPDSVFASDTYPFQAKFDEWGRGYKGGQRGNSTGQIHQTPDVLVEPITARTDALDAVKAIAEQGEATEGSEKSHFTRFYNIYKEWRDKDPAFPASREMATNPTIEGFLGDADYSPSDGLVVDRQVDLITHPNTKLWAHLFNVRYRMLLGFLTHSFLLDDGFNRSGAYSPRGTIVHATFGEMYNLRSIAHVLINMPLALVGSTKKAGPPFLIPYTMDLPAHEKDRWRMHQDLITASLDLIEQLLGKDGGDNDRYLNSLKEADSELNRIAQAIIDSPA